VLPTTTLAVEEASLPGHEPGTPVRRSRLKTMEAYAG